MMPCRARAHACIHAGGCRSRRWARRPLATPRCSGLRQPSGPPSIPSLAPPGRAATASPTYCPASLPSSDPPYGPPAASRHSTGRAIPLMLFGAQIGKWYSWLLEIWIRFWCLSNLAYQSCFCLLDPASGSCVCLGDPVFGQSHCLFKPPMDPQPATEIEILRHNLIFQMSLCASRMTATVVVPNETSFRGCCSTCGDFWSLYEGWWQTCGRQGLPSSLLVINLDSPWTYKNLSGYLSYETDLVQKKQMIVLHWKKSLTWLVTVSDLKVQLRQSITDLSYN